MNEVCSNIKKYRECRRYTHEYMAKQMGITQPAYTRMENGQTRITLPRLSEIAEILGIEPAALFNTSKLVIQTQTNQEGAYGNGYIENLHIENRETTATHNQTLMKEIECLKAEVKNLHIENKETVDMVKQMFMKEIINLKAEISSLKMNIPPQ
ncbi:MAG: helix-turn-helix transcriptional regulator [Tannerellaceae bacterium]|nr:helix-turn-helix transcriptional regulator [Tannerellaceae bacterium]